MFRLEDEYIRSFNKEKYLNVQGATDTEGRHIQCNEKKTGKIHQQWDVVYVDQWKGEPTKGELNEDFGFYVERPFHIISLMKPYRYMEVIGRPPFQPSVKRRNGQQGQKFWFDQKSLTIKTPINPGWSFNISGNGRGEKLQVSGTNSYWW
jgi:hypothetical protein